MDKKEALTKIVYPVKEIKDEQNFKNHLIMSLDMNQNLDLTQVNSMSNSEYIEFINGMNFPEIDEPFELAHLHKLMLSKEFDNLFENLGFNIESVSNHREALESGKIETSFTSKFNLHATLTEFKKEGNRKVLNKSFSKEKTQSI